MNHDMELGTISKIEELIKNYNYISATKDVRDIIIYISKLISNGDTIIVGLSGGADSVALTHFLYKISGAMNLKIIGCHVNHGIRDKESDRDQEFTQNYCKELNIELLKEKVDLITLSKEYKKSIEETGRIIRYKIFNKYSNQYNAKIAVAHNLNDKVETVILNLIRGTGLKGLGGIPALRGNIVRPFLKFTRDEIETYCNENKLLFVTDSSNLSLDYSRNIIRHKIIPIISKINYNYTSTINRTCDIILEDESFLFNISIDILSRITSKDGYNTTELLKISTSIRNRIIKEILKIHQLSYSKKKIDLIYEFLLEDFEEIICQQKNKDISYRSKKISLGKDWYCVKSKVHFNILNIPNKTNENIELEINKIGIYNFNNKQLEIKNIRYQELKEKIIIDKSILKWCIDIQKLDGNLILRNRIPGDIINLSYRKVSKSVKK